MNLKDILINKTIVDVEFGGDWYTYLKFSDGTQLQIGTDEEFTVLNDHEAFYYNAFDGELQGHDIDN